MFRDQLWVAIEGSKLTNDYVTALGNSIITHCSNMVIPKADVAGDGYEIFSTVNSQSDAIMERLTNTNSDTNNSNNNSNRVMLLDKVCRIKGCTLPNHGIVLKLHNAIPCYQLGAENSTDGYHYHHDKVHHWYATEEKKGQCVSLSPVTNNFNTVIKKVTASKAFQIHYFHSTVVGPLVLLKSNTKESVSTDETSVTSTDDNVFYSKDKKTCDICKMNNHVEKDCFKRICKRCKGTGHDVENCPTPRRFFKKSNSRTASKPSRA